LFYHNGVPVSRDKDLSKDKDLISGGKLIIGQYQESYGGNFESDRLMVGHLVGLNIWSRLFSADEVYALYNTTCVKQGGDVVSWSYILKGEFGGTTTRNCPTTCTSG
jgi:hypothetical protein